MQLYVLKNGDEMGPLELDEVRALLADGRLAPTDQAWHEGAKSWAPLSTIPEAMAEPKAQTATVKVERAAPVKETARPMASASRDLKNLKANTASTAGELSGFMAEMRGSSPREMLGAIAQSNLMRSLLVSIAIIAFLLTAFTGLAFLFAEKKYIKANPKAANTAVFHSLDANGDGKLSADELLKAPSTLMELDKNQDGELTGEELKVDGTLVKAPPRNESNGTLAAKGKPDPAKAMGVSGKKAGQPTGPNLFDNKTGGGDILDDLKKNK